MPIKKILVPLSGHEGFEAPHEVALETGLLLGERFAAHVEAFHAAGEAAGGRAFIPAGMPGSASEELMRAMEGEDRRRGERARALFAQVTARHNPPQAVAPGDPAGFSVDYVELPGPADELIAARGRLADLTICPSPSLDDHRRPPLGLEAALRETGRPLLVVPPEMPETLGKRVAIGWNGSVEAARALALGWDLVAGAEEVLVLALDDGAAPLLPGGEQVAEYLRWHGLTAPVTEIEANAWIAGGQLIAGAIEAGADLIVMGAYSHHLMRRLIFGVSGIALAQSTIPVLMAE